VQAPAASAQPRERGVRLRARSTSIDVITCTHAPKIEINAAKRDAILDP
jgi:hypothetical protein